MSGSSADLQTLMDSVSVGEVSISGAWTLDSPVHFRPGVYLRSDGAVFRFADDADPFLMALNFSGVDSTGILGTLKIDGNSASQNYPADVPSLYQVGVKIGAGCSNINFGQIFVCDIAGTGFSVGANNGYSSGVNIDKIIAKHCWNNGLAITSGENINIRYLMVSETGSNKNYSETGFNVEPNSTADIVRDINIGHLFCRRNNRHGAKVTCRDGNTQGGVTFGRLIAACNVNSGLMLSSCRDIAVNDICSYCNGDDGVSGLVSVNNIAIRGVAQFNGKTGFYFVPSGADGLSSSDIDLCDTTAKSNNQGGGVRDGYRFSGQINGVRILRASAIDNQRTATQRYGLFVDGDVTNLEHDIITAGNKIAGVQDSRI